jgi:hypothetical protein
MFWLTKNFFCLLCIIWVFSCVLSCSLKENHIIIILLSLLFEWILDVVLFCPFSIKSVWYIKLEFYALEVSFIYLKLDRIQLVLFFKHICIGKVFIAFTNQNKNKKPQQMISNFNSHKCALKFWILTFYELTLQKSNRNKNIYIA